MYEINRYINNIESFQIIKNWRLPKNMEEFMSIDKGIRSLVNTLNRMRGFVILESCYGHINKVDMDSNECTRSGYICMEIFDFNWLLAIQLIASVSEMSISRGFNDMGRNYIIEYAMAGYQYIEDMPFTIILHPVLVLDHKDRVKRWQKSVKRMEEVLDVLLKQELSDVVNRAVITSQFEGSVERFLNKETILGLFSNIPLKFDLLEDKPILSKNSESEKNERTINTK